MKKLSTISLFVFAVIVISVLTSGLVFYQNKKDNKVRDNQTGALVSKTIDQIQSSGKSIILNTEEISKHNKQSDCWVIISGKVYDITSYFGSHPGGNTTMAPTCGIDATAAYMTRDPNAKTASGSTKHSSYARDLLKDYYLGDVNQVIGKSNVVNSDPVVSKNTENKITNPVEDVNKDPIVKPVNNVVLNMTEISKHNKQSDCWMLINGKVYNITSYFGSHPGGNSPMSATCGIDATDAYMTKDPNATSSSTRSAHSSNAVSLLSKYYIGDLNQTIGGDKIIQTSNIVSSPNYGDEDEYEEYDD